MLIWTLVVVAALALVVLALMPRPVPADFAELQRGELRVTLDQEGKTRVRDRFVISAPTPGRVLRLGLDPGDPVVAGETVLATFRPLNPVPLDARSRAEAKARVKSAQAALDRARAERGRVREEHELAMKERERALRLAEQGIVSQERLDAAETDARAKAEALAAAEAAARNAASDLELANAGLLEPGGSSSGDLTVLKLFSPVDGVVLKRERQSEAIVPAGEALLEVGDPADLEVVADYLSMDAVRIRPGMRALIDRWGGDHVLEAAVRRVEPSGFMKVSALGVEEQRVNVIVDFAEPGDAAALGDEYRVEVRVVIDERDDALKLPTGALFRDGDAWAVFAVEGGKARLRHLELGARSSFEAEVLEGLSEGDTVVIHPSELVADGVRVKSRER